MSKPAEANTSEVTLESIGTDLVSSDLNETPKADAERRFFEQTRSKLILKALGQDLDERKKYAGRIFWLVAVWLFLIAILLTLQGFGETLKFHLSDQVILTVIGAATIKLLGILYVIANYLFPQRLTVVEQDENKSSTSED